jgi:Fungal specific transcription factor domain
MKEAIMHHASLSRVQRDLKAMQVNWKNEKADAMPLKDLNLLDLFPGREIVDHLVRLYFDTFETAYRILHAPTFWRDYQGFWEDPQAARPSLIVTILLSMAAVNCVSSREQLTYIGDSATAREAAILWIEACDLWLQRQSQKHVHLPIWQIRCLSLLAKMSNTVKKKRTWTSAGNLMRQAMSAGFHRDPSLLGTKVSVFDQEMRRRLWATMVELELQASIDRGMPSASAGFPSDVAPVLNVNDENFEEGSQKAPIQKPWDEYTATSFLHMSTNTLSLRVSLNSLLNELSSHAQYEDVLMYDEKIMQKLQEIPARTDSGAGQEDLPFPEMLRTLLDVQLRQFLILLHGPFARQAQSNSRYSLSKMVCFNAASSIIDQHSRLVASGNHTLLLFRNDVFRASLSICHNIHVSTSIQSKWFQVL